MIRAVLDTNIFISSLFWRGVPHHIVQRGLGGDFIIIISPEIIKEIGETLYSKFKFPAEDTRSFLEIIIVNSYLVEPRDRVEVIKKDPSDNKIIECAVAGRAHFIVSGDRHLLDLRGYGGIKIVTARKFSSFL